MTDKSPYQPVSCEIHSELELAAMRNQPVILTLSTGDNQPVSFCKVIIQDFIVQDKAEYAKVLIEGDETLIRLDHILGIDPA